MEGLCVVSGQEAGEEEIEGVGGGASRGAALCAAV